MTYCTHNSARSMLADALLRHIVSDRFVAYSAGSSPRDQQEPNPLNLETLRQAGIAVQGLQSKSWDVYAAPDTPRMD